jgi:hypothetical protein
MIRNAETIAMMLLLIGVNCPQALGQQPPPAILTIDVQNVVEYQGDISDPSKFATSPAGVGAFSVNMVFGDIVAVNSEPAKGVYVGSTSEDYPDSNSKARTGNRRQDAYIAQIPHL